MKYTVTFPAFHTKKEVEAGTVLLDVIREMGYPIETPCGGKGRCGKCKVVVYPTKEEKNQEYRKVEKGHSEYQGIEKENSGYWKEEKENQEYCKAEKGYSEYQKIRKGNQDYQEAGKEDMEGQGRTVVSVCTWSVYENICVEFLHAELRAVPILTDFVEQQGEYTPVCVSIEVQISPNKIGEYEHDVDRLQQAIAVKMGVAKEELSFSLEAVREAAELLQEADYHLYAVVCGCEVIHISQNPIPCYMAAFDIGTTTIAGYLVNSADGKVEAVASMRNPQREFGADVISRATFAAEGGLEKLAENVQGAVRELLLQMEVQAQISMQEIYFAAFVGNTCMHHLFLSILPKSLLTVPYNAVVSGLFTVPAKELGIMLGKGAQFCMLPVIAGFVGADTVGCLLAIDFYREQKMTLMIDIGTNGELVLGNCEKAMSCSTAAGPALEGATIQFGMCAGNGAISHASVQEEELILEVIGEAEAVGICGSGIIDLLAVLRQTGMIDKRGRIVSMQKVKTEFAKQNAWRLELDESGHRCIRLTDSVYLTQQDIREVQLAKSAIRSGIEILRQKMNLTYDEIAKVKLAGAFGNFMRVESACAIGLIPMELKEKVESIGNAAGAGALRAVRQKNSREEALELVKRIQFQELASEAEFQKIYVQNLNFNE